jgi:hypothetical protein
LYLRPCTKIEAQFSFVQSRLCLLNVIDALDCKTTWSEVVDRPSCRPVLMEGVSAVEILAYWIKEQLSLLNLNESSSEICFGQV